MFALSQVSIAQRRSTGEQHQRGPLPAHDYTPHSLTLGATRRAAHCPEAEPGHGGRSSAPRRASPVAAERSPAFAVVAAFPLPPLLVKGDELDRVQRRSVPRVPAAPLARVALLGGYGSPGAAMERLIPPIREHLRTPALLADRQEVRARGGILSEDFGHGVLMYGQRKRPRVRVAARTSWWCVRRQRRSLDGGSRRGFAAVVEPERQGVRSCAKRRRASRSRKRHAGRGRFGARACSEADTTRTTEPSEAERTTSRPSAGESLTVRS